MPATTRPSMQELSRRRLARQFYRAGGLLSFAAVARFGKARNAALSACLDACFVTRTATGYALTDAGKTEARR